MSKPISMMSVALVTAAASVVLPQIVLSNPSLTTPTFAPLSSSPKPKPMEETTPSSEPTKNQGTKVGIQLPVDQRPLKLEWDHKHHLVAQLFLRNDREIAQKLETRVIAQDRLGKIWVIQDNMLSCTSIDTFSRKCSLSIGVPPTMPLPAKGFLEIGSTPADSVPDAHGSEPAARARETTRRIASTESSQKHENSSEHEILLPEVPGPTLAGWIFAYSLITAGVIVLITIWSLKRLKSKKITLRSPMGSPKWSFQQSWGANITIAAGLLGTLLTLAILPDHPHYMTRDSYRLLQSLFAALVLLAPLAYGLFRRDIQTSVNNIAGIDNQGYVFTFLIAGGLVLWGALGQALTLSFLLTESLVGNTIDLLVGRILWGLAAMLLLSLIVYGFRSLYKTAKEHSATAEIAAGTQPRERRFSPGAVLPTDIAENLKPPLSQWPFL